MINDLVDLAITEKDHATNNLLAWYVNEQVEEVAAAKYIVEKITVMVSEDMLCCLQHPVQERT